MTVTDVRLHIPPADATADNRVKAYVVVTFDNCFVVRHIRIVKTDKGLLVSMPSRKLPDGTHKDVAHPINAEFRAVIDRAVLAQYHSQMLSAEPDAVKA